MGAVTHKTPQRFAEELRAYAWSLIEPEGADASGRWLEAKTSKARSRDYWRKITSGEQALTTNDIEVLARLFDQSPYDFIRAARRWNRPPGELIAGRFGVSADDQDLREVAAESIEAPHPDETPDQFDA